MGSKQLSGIKSMHVDSLACVRVKGGEGEQFRIDSGVRQGCIVSPWLFNVYMAALTKELKMRIGRRVRFLKEEGEWRLPSLLYADDLVPCGVSEEDLGAMMGWFVEVCRKRGLKVNAGKSKVMVMNGEEGFECEDYVDGIRLEQVSEFKYLGCILDKSVTDGGECSRKAASGSGGCRCHQVPG